MEVRNCKKCGNLFNYTGETTLCPKCEKEMNDKFYEVREYIYQNPHASMSVVAEENDIPIQQIKKWVRQERLSFTKEAGVSIDCESCGKPILTGRYCKECKRSMTNTFTSMYSEKPKQDGRKSDAKGRMRFINNQ